MQCNFEKTGTTDGIWYSTKCINKAEILIINDPCYGLCYVCAYQKLQAKLAKARTYTGLEGYPCPLCIYENGKFIEACVMHKQIKELQAKNETLRVITNIKDPEQHFEQIMSANKQLQAEKEKLKAMYDVAKGDIEDVMKGHEETDSLVDQLQAELERHRWIPVSERLPESRVRVLTIGAVNETETTEPAVAWIGEQGEWYSYGNNSGYYKPIYWMPIILPKENNGKRS